MLLFMSDRSYLAAGVDAVLSKASCMPAVYIVYRRTERIIIVFPVCERLGLIHVSAVVVTKIKPNIRPSSVAGIW
jgi:hypothetical protein